MLIRAVVALAPDQNWQIYRQSQWMALLRRDFSAATWLKIHVDIDEQNYQIMLQARHQWQSTPPGEIKSVLDRFGAVTIAGPGTSPHQG